jgi:hypothetical protein
MMAKNSILLTFPLLVPLALLPAAPAAAVPVHVTLVDRLSALIDGAPVPPLDNDHFYMLGQLKVLPSGKVEGEGTRGTLNFQAMAWAAEYVRVWRGGEIPKTVPPKYAQAYKDYWRQKALEYFERERDRGLMGAEQMCADPHHNFHVAAAAAIRLGAREFKHQELIDASGRYFRDLFAVYTAVATPDGTICMAGARAKGAFPPCTEVGSMIYRTVRGLPQQGVSGRDEASWRQTYYAAARAVRQLVRQGDDLGGAAKMRPEDLASVKLAYPMRVERYADRVRTMIPEDPGPFYLREQFGSFTEVRFAPEWLNFRKLQRAGLLTFIKGWSAPPPPPGASKPEVIASSLAAAPAPAVAKERR